MNPSNTNRASEQPLLIAYDLSEVGGVALHRGLTIAHATGSTPHILYVGAPRDDKVRFGDGDESATLDWDEAARRLQRVIETRLQEFSERFGPARFPAVYSHLHAGDPVDEALTLANKLKPALILCGTHGRRGLRRAVLGSVAEKLVRTAPCPVLVVRPFDYGEGQASVTIEPPCPRCMAIQRQTGGRQLWCEEHSDSLGRRHTYHEVPRNVRSQENLPMFFPMNA